MTHELSQSFPVQIVRGALLRADGVAVGLVSGGAPAWELMGHDDRAQIGSAYHRLLLALDTPVDLYRIDQPPDLEREIAEVRLRQSQAMHPLLHQALAEITDYLSELSQLSSSRAKQVIWTVTSQDASASSSQPNTVATLMKRHRRQTTTADNGKTFARALERARRLVDALQALGGSPPARLMEAEEIARLVYTLADPVRAGRYPLAGTLLDRVWRVMVLRQG